MEKKFKLSTELPLMVMSMIPLVMTLILWNRLPDQVPVHWNLSGEVDGYGPKIVTPLINIGLYGLLLLVMFIDPKKQNYQKFRSIYNKMRIVLTVFFVAISSIVIFVAMGYEIDTNRFFLVSIPLLFTLLGNFLINVKPNWMVGVRTPWTLASENVWRKTHRLTGLMWFWGGLVCLVTAFMIEPYYAFRIMFAVVIGTSAVAILYSYFAFRKEKTNTKTE